MLKNSKGIYTSNHSKTGVKSIISLSPGWSDTTLGYSLGGWVVDDLKHDGMDKQDDKSLQPAPHLI